MRDKSTATVEEKQGNNLTEIVLPGFSTFVACSTFISCNIYLSLGVAGCAAVLTVFALHAICQNNNKEKGKNVHWPRIALVFLEIVGIICVAVDLIQKDVAKRYEGISLLMITLLLACVLAYIEYKEHRANQDKQNNALVSIKSAKQFITFYMVMVGTYPLFVDFFSGFNQGKPNALIIVTAIIFATSSSVFQAYLINYEKPEEQSSKNQFKPKLFKWLGLTFISLELILSLANTAFSNNNSSMKELLWLSHDKWVEVHSHKIGLVLFTIAILFFAVSSIMAFKSDIKEAFVKLLQNYRQGFSIISNTNDDNTAIPQMTPV